MNHARRLLLAAVGAVPLSPIVHAHTPYRQWVVYRQKHLLIGCHRENLQTWDLAQEINHTLTRSLPDARSRIARARTAGRLASLLGTDQLDSAVLSHPVARAMSMGRQEFKAYGEIELRTIAVLGEFSYVVRANFPDDHASLLAAALVDLADDVDTKPAPAVPWHQGLRNPGHP